MGRYGRGIVAMARTPPPNSQGSQFFIVLDDVAEGALAAANTYAIFGRVVEGMDVVDEIAAMPNSGEPDNTALEPVTIITATVEQVTLPPEPIPGDPDLEAMMPVEVNGESFEARSNNGAELGPRSPTATRSATRSRRRSRCWARPSRTCPSAAAASARRATALSITGLRVQGVEAAAHRGVAAAGAAGFRRSPADALHAGRQGRPDHHDGPDSDTAQRFYVYGTGDTVFVVQGTEP